MILTIEDMELTFFSQEGEIDTVQDHNTVTIPVDVVQVPCRRNRSINIDFIDPGGESRFGGLDNAWAKMSRAI